MGSVSKIRNWQIIVGFLFLAGLWFFNINHIDLLKPDEGRYAEIGREMAYTNDFVTPRINGIKYFEKPPLQYWMTALSFEVFGEHNWSARLWSSLTGFLTLLALFLFTRRYYGFDRAVMAVAALSGSMLFAVLGHINILDMGVSFFLTLTALSLSVLLSRNETKKDYFWANVVFWLSISLGFLSKGLMAVVLPGLAGVIFILLRREWAIFKRVRWFSGVLLCLVITLPWMLLVSQRNPEWAHFFFIHEHVERFLTKVHHREGPWWYFLPFLLIGCFPWNFFILRLRNLDAKNLFFLIWSVSIFVFFSTSSSKLVPYVLPVWPTLALLAATSLDDKAKPRDIFYLCLGYFALGILFDCGSVFVSNMTSKTMEDHAYVEFSHYLLGGGIGLTATSLVVYFIKWSRLAKIAMLGVMSLLSTQILLFGYNAFTPSISSRVLAQALQPKVNDEMPLYMVHYYEHELPFYLKRLVTLVEYQGELEFGLQNENTGRYKTFSEFAEEWSKAPQAMAVMAPDTERLLTQHQLKYKIIYQDKRRIAVMKE